MLTVNRRTLLYGCCSGGEVEVLIALSVYEQNTHQCFSIPLKPNRIIADRIKGRCSRSCKNIRGCKLLRPGNMLWHLVYFP